MALGKDIDTEFGVPASYWNIGARSEDFKGGGVEVVLYGYANEQARRDNKQPLAAAKVQLVGENYTPESTRTELYDKIKEVDSSFAGAADLGENV